MKNYFHLRPIQSLGLVLVSVLMLACSDAGEQEPEEVKDTLYFKFTLEGNQYMSEIKESNLIPGSGNEKMDETSDGMNFMMYAYYSNIIWMNYSDKCGASPGRDCLAFQIQVPENLKEGTYSSLFTYGITVNGQGFERFADSSVNMVITKYDEEANVIEGTVNGQFKKSQDTSGDVFDLNGEFRLYIFTN